MKTVSAPSCLISILLLPALASASSLTSTRPAQVNTGFAFHLTGGVTSPVHGDTYWFYDLAGDNSHPDSSPLPLAEAGVTLGDRRVHLGLFARSPCPQVEVYGQLYDGKKVDVGVGARAGIPVFGWAAHQAFLRSDYQLRRNIKLLVDPGVYYHTGKSPNGETKGSLLFFTQSVGLAFTTRRVTFTPSLSLVTGSGDIKRWASGSEHHRDTFAAVSISVSFHRPVE